MATSRSRDLEGKLLKLFRDQKLRFMDDFLTLFRAARGGGLAPLKTASISARRPDSASAMPCLKDSGIQESSFSTTNLATCARSFAGRALICSIISCALTVERTAVFARSGQTRLRFHFEISGATRASNWFLRPRFQARPRLAVNRGWAGSRSPD